MTATNTTNVLEEDTTKIQPGTEYTLEYTPGHKHWTIQVRAESGVWENSKGIRGFDATLLEPLGNKESGDFHIIQMHHFEVVSE